MEGQRDWTKMVHALVDDIENRNEPVVGLGHSFGGAMMLCAASARPNLFRQVIIIGNLQKSNKLLPNQGPQVAP
jgi:alpha-beta hydrolase superfamily lysophospholipase